MNIARLIAYCREQGIEFSLVNDTVRIRGTYGNVEGTLPLLRAHREAIIQHLKSEQNALLSSSPELDLPPVFTVDDMQKAMQETREIISRLTSRQA